MAKLTVLGSGSKGNGYILECKDITLILEIGITWTTLMSGLNYNLDRRVVALCTHDHGDHINKRTLRKCLNYQIPVYSTVPASVSHTGVKPLYPKQMYKFGEASIMPLKVPHGDCFCLAYLIMHPEIGNLIFATDLSYFPYKLSAIDHILIECNNSEDVIMENMEAGKFSPSRHEDHLSLEKCMDTIMSLRSPRLQNVMLLHLSGTNADSDMFCDEIVRRVGIRPYIASAGLSIDLSKEDF